MGLNAVSLLVIVGEVEELQSQVGPDSPHSCRAQLSNVNHLVLLCQDKSRVAVLNRKFTLSADSMK